MCKVWLPCVVNQVDCWIGKGVWRRFYDQNSASFEPTRFNCVLCIFFRFRIKAFELRVRETRLRLSQLKSYCDDGETEKPAAVFWGRSVSLEAYPQLRPLLHAVHVAKKTKLFRFQSLTEALTVKREVASAVVLPEANVNGKRLECSGHRYSSGTRKRMKLATMLLFL